MHKLDSELLTAFMELNKKIDGHYRVFDQKMGDHHKLFDKKIDNHSIKIAKICTYIENQQKEEETKKEESNKKFYVIIAVIGVGFGMFQALQSMGLW